MSKGRPGFLEHLGAFGGALGGGVAMAGLFKLAAAKLVGTTGFIVIGSVAMSPFWVGLAALAVGVLAAHALRKSLHNDGRHFLLSAMLPAMLVGWWENWAGSLLAPSTLGAVTAPFIVGAMIGKEIGRAAMRAVVGAPAPA